MVWIAKQHPFWEADEHYLQLHTFVIIHVMKMIGPYKTVVFIIH